MKQKTYVVVFSNGSTVEIKATRYITSNSLNLHHVTFLSGKEGKLVAEFANLQAVILAKVIV